MTMVKCQQQDIHKIRDGIPGHGLQKVMCRFQAVGSERVQLECGCSLPILWLPYIEQDAVRRDVLPPRQRTRKV